jgi:hypothetical protein
MNRNNKPKIPDLSLNHLLLSLLLTVTFGFGALVDRNEAVAIADLWFAMELNSGYLKIEESERLDGILRLPNSQLSYLVSKDELLDTFPVNRTVLAYIVKYDPVGFIIVSGEDRIEPIIVFSTDSKFRWDQPERNFLRYFLGNDMSNRWAHLGMHIHKNWSYLRSRLYEPLDKVKFDKGTDDIYVLWNTALWDQDFPYNDTVIAHNGNTPGIPTGCVATAMAIKMRFHEWPPVGLGFKGYQDGSGEIQYYHEVDYSAQSYNWSVMPETSLTQSNAEVARLMYHSGVSVLMDYEVDSSKAYQEDIDDALNYYFRYKGTEYHTSNHFELMKKSILGRLPINCAAGRHSFIADGYREPDYRFHINCGWSSYNNGWYLLDSMPFWPPPAIGKSCPFAHPNNWIYVNGDWSGSENGNIQNPYNTLLEGETEVPNGGKLMIKEGTYTGSGNVPITFTGDETILTYEGTVNIGSKLRQTTDGVIQLYNNGGLKIHETDVKMGKN